MTSTTALPGAGMDAFFKANGIAIIGASDDPTKIGGRPVYLLRKYGYKGPIYPINPRGGTIQDIPAYTSVLDLPTAPDMAIIVVAAEHVASALRDCATRGVKAAAVLSAGFTETGPEGEAMQNELVRSEEHTSELQSRENLVC